MRDIKKNHFQDRILNSKIETKNFWILNFSRKYSQGTLYRWYIQSNMAIEKAKVIWIMHQSSHNARWSQTNFKSGQVFKIENRNEIFRNLKYLPKISLQNLISKLHTKYQCHRKSRSMMNHVHIIMFSSHIWRVLISHLTCSDLTSDM